MCDTCGCGHDEIKILDGDFSEHGNGEHHHHEGHQHDHHHYHHDHDHSHHHATISLESDVLLQNNFLAERNRGYFEAKNIAVYNLVSSPGSGKTTLLEKWITELKNDVKVYVIEGDQQTTNDALRIQNAGAKAVQVNTGKGCHLDADMVNRAIKMLQPANDSILFIENVGNLVCPSLFDLGERKRIVIFSVTEGDDKPLKYPNIFESADICIINKTDLLPYVEFDMEKAKQNALKVNHHLQLFEASATKGEGLKSFIEHVKNNVAVS